MRPPICEICDVKFGDDNLNVQGHGGLIEFKPDADDKAHIARMQIKGWIGHPPNMGWFCKLHVEDARALRHRSHKEALQTLRKKFRDAQGSGY